MLASFVLGLVCLVTVPILMVYQRAKLRSRAFIWVPLLIATNLGITLVLAVLTQKFLASGWFRLFTVAGGAGILTYYAGREIERVFEPKVRKIYTVRLLLIIAGLAALCLLDTSLLLGKQGWPFQDWTLIKNSTPYFSPPFHVDAERNVVITNSLIRNDDSAFLYRSSLKYPLGWYHLAALITAPFNAKTNLPLIFGVNLLTGFFFFFFLLWSLFLIRPTLWMRRPIAVILFIALFAHADIFHFIYSLVVSGKPGIESDGSFTPLFFRNFSLKLLATTAPGPTLALLFALLYVVAGRLIKHRDNLLNAIQIFCFTLCLFVSPSLTLILFPPLFLAQGIRWHASHRPLGAFALKVATLILGGSAVFWAVDGNSPWELAQAPFLGDIVIPLMHLDSGQWIGLPALWIASLGLLGIFVSIGILILINSKSPKPFLTESALFILGMGLFYHYLITGMEIRRHFSMAACMLAPLFLSQILPHPRRWMGKPEFRLALPLVAVIGMGLHFFFLYMHIGRGSVINPKIPWGDYFAMNQIIAEKYPKLPTLAATPQGLGFPPVMEVTSSFASPRYASLISRPTPVQSELLMRMSNPTEIPAYGNALGYRAILWGPIEEQMWGERGRNRFIQQEKMIAKKGSVALYELSDNLTSQFLSRHSAHPGSRGAPQSAEFHFELAEALAKGGWYQEAVDHYLETLRLKPDHARAHNNLGLILANQGNAQSALQHFANAMQSDPKMKDAYNNMGAVLVMSGQPSQAIEILKRGIALRPDPELYINLGQAYTQINLNAEALQSYRKALQLKPNETAKYQALIGIGDSQVRSGAFRSALVSYRQLVALQPKDFQIHTKLGNVYAYLGQMEAAKQHFDTALSLNPRYEPAKRALASLLVPPSNAGPS